MNDTDDLAPVDYVVVGFPAGAHDFGCELARELASLVDAEMVRVLDIVILDKDEQGNVAVIEVQDLGPRNALRVVESRLSEVLDADEVERLSEAIAPGSSAGVVVWENIWASHLVDAARSSGGQVVATGSIPTDRIAARSTDQTGRRRA